jgi:hypothetical protein
LKLKNKDKATVTASTATTTITTFKTTIPTSNARIEFTLVDHVKLENPFQSFISFNEFECFKHCHLNHECKAASFSTDPLKSSCFLFKNDYVVKTEQTWITYFKKPNTYTQKDLDHFKIKNNLRLQNHFLSTFDKKNELECFQLCETTIDCAAASFSFVLFKSGCFLYHEGYSSKDEPDWISFIKTSLNLKLFK